MYVALFGAPATILASMLLSGALATVWRLVGGFWLAAGWQMGVDLVYRRVAFDCALNRVYFRLPFVFVFCLFVGASTFLCYLLGLGSFPSSSVGGFWGWQAW